MAEKGWIEIISLRLSGSGNRKAILDIFNQVSQGKRAHPDYFHYAELFANTTIETDWSIYIHWPHQAGHPSKTVLGSSIAEAFQSLGLVNHSVWEKKYAKRGTDS